MWILLGALSSVFLGVYDVFKKASLKENAVIPVLFFATLTGALIFLPFIVASRLFPHFSSGQLWFVPEVDGYGHFLFFVKAVIVGSSWILAYFALKNLPITIVAPIRASAPLWVLIGAIILFGETLTPYQWAGLIVTLIFYYFFSTAGKKEGIAFRNNKWIYFIFLATLIGAVSSLFDKYLTARYDRLALQAYFSVYLALILLPVAAFIWYPKRRMHTPFRWKAAIPLIGISLVLADFLYFYALSIPGSLVAVVSTIRRGSVLTSFLLGALIFREEKNKKLKGLILLGILAGLLLVMLGGYW